MKMKKINFLNLMLLLVISYNLQCAHPDEVEIVFFDDPASAIEQDELTKLISKSKKPSGAAQGPKLAIAGAAGGAAKASMQQDDELAKLINKSKPDNSAAVGSGGGAGTATAVTKQYSLTPQHLQSQFKQNSDAAQKQSKSARMAEKSVNKIFQFTGSALASLQITGVLSANQLTVPPLPPQSANQLTVPPLPPQVERELEKLLGYETNIEKAINDINQDEFKRVLESIKIIEPKKIIRIKNLIEDKIMELRAQAIENNGILFAPEEKPGQHDLLKSENINLQQKILALEGFKDILRAQNFKNLKAALENIDIHRVINAKKINDLFEVIESINLEEVIDLDRLVDSKIGQMKTSRLGHDEKKLNVDILNDNIRAKLVKKRK